MFGKEKSVWLMIYNITINLNNLIEIKICCQIAFLSVFSFIIWAFFASMRLFVTHIKTKTTIVQKNVSKCCDYMINS